MVDGQGDEMLLALAGRSRLTGVSAEYNGRPANGLFRLPRGPRERISGASSALFGRTIFYHLDPSTDTIHPISLVHRDLENFVRLISSLRIK